MVPDVDAPAGRVDDEAREPEPVWVDLGLAVVLASGLLLRFWAESPLWLDEALTVNIAKLPLGELGDALRRDGAPPLFYALLKGWMVIAGDSDVAVRALSGVASVLSLPLMYLCGRRVAGREGGWVAVALLAASPFAIRYATETRMYSVVTLLTLLGFLALDSFLARPTTPRLAAVMAVSALLVLTHYWALFLVAALLGTLALHADRSVRRMPSSWAMIGIATGSLALLPWLDVFLFQIQHTGTPWARPPRLSSVIGAFQSFGGVDSEAAALLGPFLLGLAVLGSIGRRYDHRRVLLDLRGSSPGRGLWAVALGTLVSAVVTGLVTGGGFAPRYASVVLAPFILLVMLGTQAFGDVRIRAGIVALLCALGLFAATATARAPRTQAGDVAAVLNRAARPTDLVVYCPDQLGPAVDRLLTKPVRQVTFPAFTTPRLVDWVDYAERMKAASTAKFASEAHRRAGRRDIWFVWSFGYRGLDRSCEQLEQHFANVRPVQRTFVRLRTDVGPEHEHLTRYSVPEWPAQPGPRRR